MRQFIFLLPILFKLNALACDGGFPGRSLTVDIGSKSVSGVTKEQFHETVKRFEKFFGPVIEDEHDEELIVYASWASNTVNAYAEKKKGKVIITVYGGMARHPAINLDGFQAVLCHELGHHFGGFPKKRVNKWSSAEGQADYYASMKCLRRLWQAEDNESHLAHTAVPETVVADCAKAFSSGRERFLCQRMSLAGKSFALMIQALDWDSIEPRFDTPDPMKVKATKLNHPFSQCRLDTFFEGALCSVSETEEFDDADEVIGSCHVRRGDQRGLRPRCWFAPET